MALVSTEVCRDNQWGFGKCFSSDIEFGIQACTLHTPVHKKFSKWEDSLILNSSDMGCIVLMFNPMVVR